jgi:hypothetical protein
MIRPLGSGMRKISPQRLRDFFPACSLASSKGLPHPGQLNWIIFVVWLQR